GEVSDWALSDGVLSGPGTNQPIAIIDMIARIDQSLRVDPGVPTGPPDAVAQRPQMRGLRDMIAGRYVFVHDLDAPGMLHARVVRPPHANARLKRFANDRAEKLHDAGLSVIRDGSFIAIAGPAEWKVVTAARQFAGACDWSDNGGLPEIDVFAVLKTANATRLTVIDSKPSTSAGIAPPLKAPDHSARYERPFTLHGALAPSAAMATWAGGRLSIKTHSQGIYPLRTSIAESLGLDSARVELTHVPGSGCYGHNGADDAAFEAAIVAMAIPGVPILLKWTREQEHCWEPVGTAMAVELAATLGTSGNINAISAEAISGTHRGRPRPGADRAGPRKLLANHLRADAIAPLPPSPNMNRHGGMHRNLDPVYDIPVKRLVKNLIGDLPHRTSALRCLGAAANIFALESFIDELAHKAGRDPLEFRLAHLRDARARAVLTRLATEISVLHPPGPGGGRGVAYAQYKNSMTRVAVCVDLTLDDRAEIQLEQAVIVADAGRVIDLDGLTAQLEGGFLQGASWALYERTDWDRGGILSRDWDSYPVIRFDNVPPIETIILNQPDAASVGAGEAAPPPTIAAIANAVHAASGLRIRRLPLTSDAILQQALDVPD
ncbi:MAG: molybdopterin-dependent oxidoreductase, partial [Rhodobacter sp.]|nr:molybdopterin-dependent oxidoreductase [Rhodobacter sp.]